MSDTKTARAKIQRNTKKLLSSKNRQIAENGRDQELPVLDATSGFWTDRAKWSKAARWLIILERDQNGILNASLPQNDQAKRIAGSINSTQRIHMGVSTRVVVALKEGGVFVLLTEFEWLLLFIFPDLPVNLSHNDATSGDTASFDPADGALYMKDKYPQPYIEAQLLKTCLNPPPYRHDAHEVTYDEASDALVRFINVAPVWEQ